MSPSEIPTVVTFPDLLDQVPSEVLSLQTRSAGYALTTFMNFLMTFVVGQSFLSMMCSMKVSFRLSFMAKIYV